MKKNLTFILGIFIGILVSGGTVFAASLLSEDITYTPANTDWQATTVEEALNDLYEIKNDYTANRFVAHFYNRTYSTSYILSNVHSYNEKIASKSGNVITVKESGKYKLSYVGFRGYVKSDYYIDYAINNNITNLITISNANGNYIKSGDIEFDLSAGDKLYLQSRNGILNESVGSLSAVLYKIN